MRRPGSLPPSHVAPDAAADTATDAVYAHDLCELGVASGLDAVGIAAAEVFASTRTDLHERKATGLHAGMAFTYRHPDRSTDAPSLVPGCRSLVVGALGYRRVDPPAPSEPAARVGRYQWDDTYEELRALLRVVARRLEADGWRARVVADDNALVDREAAYRAGLGWYGKNANLLVPGRGSWFVLGTVATDAPLPPSPAPVADGCGRCTRCLDACPTGAIVAPGVVDARRCLAWLAQAPGDFPLAYRAALGDRLYGCDDCQEVCPPNRAEDRRVEIQDRQPAPTAQAWVDVLDLLAASDGELLDRHGRWYLPQRDPTVLRRNALIVLGNVGDPSDPRVAAAIGHALDQPDELVRTHAVWAARRLGLAASPA